LTDPVEELMSPSMRRTAALAVAAITALIVLPARAGADPASTQLNVADMTLLNGVRQAGLWEIPAGQMAAQKGTTAKIRQIGQMIATQHVQLDQLTVDAANKLGVTLPATPTTQQQGFLTQLQAAKGVQFNQLFVTFLRGTHGFIFPVISAVRASTHNEVVRTLAGQASIFVMHHMEMLESTGLVQYSKLPPAAMSPQQELSALGTARVEAGTAPSIPTALLWLLAAGITGIAGIATVRIVRRRRPAIGLAGRSTARS
jgi:predicted outer membrane protein